ncbi:hypothetical protein [Aeromicrobium terrae]|uniref:Uncharacterized protein n=1 Tax=Aeromicrobium terrae TaxID=2498846 RepID=A0A5C8NIB8_9ACTN|nr:hypothetical protein [Aeromicrobium terrae]TXL60920.1 hypothetical protein FHP06_10910 [Aeromicrobium terrae]
MSARNTKAKQVSDSDVAAQVRALTKPSVAAYVVNLLVRESPEEIEDLIELGDRLREAQSSQDGTTLRALDRERRELTRTIAKNGIQLAAEAGTKVSAAAEAQVDDTLRAAMADPEAADAVRTGRLTRALDASGFGGVDLDDAVAVPETLATVTPLAPRRKAKAASQKDKAIAAAREEVASAERTEKQARKVADRARRDRDAALERYQELDDEAQQLRAALKKAEQRLAAAEHDLESAREDVDEAEEDEDAAQQALDAAQRELDRLT